MTLTEKSGLCRLQCPCGSSKQFRYGCGSKPNVPFWGWLPSQGSLFQRLFGCSLGYRGFDPQPYQKHLKSLLFFSKPQQSQPFSPSIQGHPGISSQTNEPQQVNMEVCKNTSEMWQLTCLGCFIGFLRSFRVFFSFSWSF